MVPGDPRLSCVRCSLAWVNGVPGEVNCLVRIELSGEWQIASRGMIKVW